MNKLLPVDELLPRAVEAVRKDRRLVKELLAMGVRVDGEWKEKIKVRVRSRPKSKTGA